MIEVQFGRLKRFNISVNNYRHNINSLYWHLGIILTTYRALRNVVISAFLHYIDTWMINRACVVHHTVLMSSMFEFTLWVLQVLGKPSP